MNPLTVDDAQTGSRGVKYFGDLIESEDHIYRFLDTVGNGSGTIAAIGDYSTPTEFKITAGASEIIVLHRIMIQISDGSPLSADQYGNLAALTNGITLRVTDPDGVVVKDLCDGNPIKSNAAYARFCYDSKPDDYGSGANFISVRWTFSRGGYPISLEPKYSLGALLSDNLTGLLDHTFFVHGYRVGL